MRLKVTQLIFCLSLMLVTGSIYAQQDPQFSQYMFNNIYLTPAAAGIDGVTRFTAIHRSQWLGYESSFNDGGAPTTQILTFSTPIYKFKSGFGAYVMNDKLGPMNNLEVQTMYAYHLGIKDNSKISIAIKAGIYSQTLDYDIYRVLNEDEPLLQEGKTSQVRPDFGMGLMYRSEKYYAGFGFNHLTKAKFDFGVDNVRGELANHINFTAGYFYDVNFDLQVSPSILVKTDLNEYSVDIGAVATLKNTMWGGITFRELEAVNAIIGYSLLKDKSLKVGSSLDFILKDRQAKENFSFEFLISYELPVSVGSGKKIVRTPRYRH